MHRPSSPHCTTQQAHTFVPVLISNQKTSPVMFPHFILFLCLHPMPEASTDTPHAQTCSVTFLQLRISLDAAIRGIFTLTGGDQLCSLHTSNLSLLFSLNPVFLIDSLWKEQLISNEGNQAPSCTDITMPGGREKVYLSCFCLHVFLCTTGIIIPTSQNYCEEWEGEGFLHRPFPICPLSLSNKVPWTKRSL